MAPTIALRAADKGTVYVWGDNRRGQLGVMGVVSSDVPIPLGDNSKRNPGFAAKDGKIVQIACGLYHSVALSGMCTQLPCPK